MQQLNDLTTAHPDLNAVVAVGGWPLFVPEGYRSFFANNADRFKNGKLVAVSADTLPSELQLLKEGYVAALVGQRPFEMGEKAMVDDQRGAGQRIGPANPFRKNRPHGRHLIKILEIARELRVPSLNLRGSAGRGPRRRVGRRREPNKDRNGHGSRRQTSKSQNSRCRDAATGSIDFIAT